MWRIIFHFSLLSFSRINLWRAQEKTELSSIHTHFTSSYFKWLLLNKMTHMPYFMRLIAVLSPSIPWFDPRPIHVEFL